MKTKWINENTIEYLITSAYCTGKGRLFEMFFGWRCTNKEGNAKFIMSSKDWEKINTLIEYEKRFIK